MSVFDQQTFQRLDPWGGTHPGFENGMLDPLNTRIYNEQLLNPWQDYDTWQGTQAGQKEGIIKNFRDQGQLLQPGLNQASDYYSSLMPGVDAEGNATAPGHVPNQGLDMAQVALMADNPYVTGMIDASSRDVTRNLYENQNN